MAQTSKIEWCDSTWNPVTGCTRVSPGCEHCYAETMAARIANAALKAENPTPTQRAYMAVMRKVGGKFIPRWNGKLVLDESKLDLPLEWKKPRTVFVNSMSDLWHGSVSLGSIARVYEVMEKADWHTYQVLTKRPERRGEIMRMWLDQDHVRPLAHVLEGTSIESAKYLNRLEELRQTPAAVRFLSCEPLLGDLGEVDLAGIHQVIIGGESGHGARPMDPRWARSIREQCKAQGVACFVKQMGSVLAREWRLADKKGGALEEWPQDLQIRQMPEVTR